MLTIIHTGDFHNRLGDGEAGRLAALRDGSGPCLLLDAGDAVGAGNLGFRPAGEPILERMSSLGYAAMALGNREAHLWRSIVEMKIKSAGYPVLSANITAGQPISGVEPFVELDVAGIRVGVVGVTVPMITKAMWTHHLCDLLFTNPLEAARDAAAELRPRVDLLVCLSHVGIKDDRRIAEEGLYDIVLGGHSHTVMPEPERIGGTWLCHTGSHARYAGVWTVERGSNGWKVIGQLHSLREEA
ncbi:MAG TPA: metallophosphoesterase [Armatimonadota bacterium]|jgi:2',3'-cyclic-nucleotide 2'-phosphodiesterase (5'-nucleotidase family)